MSGSATIVRCERDGTGCGDENHQSNCTDKAVGCDREKSIDISDFPCFRFCLGTPERLDKVDAD